MLLDILFVVPSKKKTGSAYMTELKHNSYIQ